MCTFFSVQSVNMICKKCQREGEIKKLHSKAIGDNSESQELTLSKAEL